MANNFSSSRYYTSNNTSNTIIITGNSAGASSDFFYVCNEPTYVGSYNVNYINEDKEKLVKKIKEFYDWLKEEHISLKEESGADISGIIDKLEEEFEDLFKEDTDLVEDI